MKKVFDVIAMYVNKVREKSLTLEEKATGIVVVVIFFLTIVALLTIKLWLPSLILGSVTIGLLICIFSPMKTVSPPVPPRTVVVQNDIYLTLLALKNRLDIVPPMSIEDVPIISIGATSCRLRVQHDGTQVLNSTARNMQSRINRWLMSQESNVNVICLTYQAGYWFIDAQ